MNATHAHDQALAHIKGDALHLILRDGLSFEILAQEFEGYWRQRVAHDLAKMDLSEAKLLSLDYFNGTERTRNVAIIVARQGLNTNE